MVHHSIDLVCIQETHKQNSDYFINDEGFLVIFSGSVGEIEHAGVGFIVAPHIRRSIYSFRQESSRMASIKLRIHGGKLTLVTTYAPHSGYPFNVRQEYFQTLGQFFHSQSGNGPKLVCGDFNSRLFRQLPGEEHIIGQHVFSNVDSQISSDANRNLLVEFCTCAGLMVSNTFADTADKQKVTCYNVGVKRAVDISWATHAQIDFLLCQQSCGHIVTSIFSDQEAALSSHHFALRFDLDVVMEKGQQTKRALSYDPGSLSVNFTATRFAQSFDDHMQEWTAAAQPDGLDQYFAMMTDAFQAAAAETLPKVPVKRQRPWISNRTLELLNQRAEARHSGAFEAERALAKAIRQSVKQDRSNWLNDLVATGGWDAVRKLRKEPACAQGRLRDGSGSIVDSDRRPALLADHLERVQWRVRETVAPGDRPVLGEQLSVNMADITPNELKKAAHRLKRKRASGLDGVPGEFWRAIIESGSSAMLWALDFCNLCLRKRCVPEDWHRSRVAMLFKKGDPADCNNYRPISLLQVGYKLFAMVLLDRLRDAGAEQRIWPTQCGFKRGRGTADAIFAARRVIEDAWATKDGRVIMLALDWEKAFDSISPPGLERALLRFGCPKDFVELISAIYSDRMFVVCDNGRYSGWHVQHNGISQGCPLSPFLFIMLMTVLMHDAKATALETAGLSAEMVVHDLVYADDTLLVDIDEHAIEGYMHQVGQAGREYGLSFNWKKIEMLPVRMQARIDRPDGQPIACKESMVYLGSSLSADGRIGSELGRRLGMAQSDFRTLQRVWAHSSVNRNRKLLLFNACIVSKLMYGLLTATMNKAELRRLDGFQARCLRSIMRIPHSYYSRVSNKSVLERSEQQPLSDILRSQQACFMTELFLRPPADPIRQLIFDDDGSERRIGRRGRGRPRTRWVQQATAI